MDINCVWLKRGCCSCPLFTTQEWNELEYCSEDCPHFDYKYQLWDKQNDELNAYYKHGEELHDYMGETEC